MARQRPTRILIVDDEPDIRDLVQLHLEREGCLCFQAENGTSGLRQAIELIPDLIVLDMMMPGMDGLEVCREIRKLRTLDQSYIVFLTARHEEMAQLSSFAIGADDYITKPIRPAILVARIQAILRRKRVEVEPEKTQVGTLTIDHQARLVIKDGATIELPRKEFELLVLFSSKPGKIFERDQIYAAIWGQETIVGDRTLDVHIRKLREKLGPDIIRTSKGIGYGILDTNVQGTTR